MKYTIIIALTLSVGCVMKKKKKDETPEPQPEPAPQLTPEKRTFSAETLEEIGAMFDIDELSSIISERFEEKTLSNFDSDTKNKNINATENMAEEVNQDSLVCNFSLANSIAYGYVPAFDFDTLNQKCLDVFEEQTASKLATFELELTEFQEEKRLKKTDSIHIQNFTAVAESETTLVAQNTLFNASFDLTESEVVYDEAFKQFGKAKGAFIETNEGIQPVEAAAEIEANRLIRTPPEGYPVPGPDSLNLYDHDPKHIACTQAKPVGKIVKDLSPLELCNDAGHSAFYPEFCRWVKDKENGIVRPLPGGINMPTFPYRGSIRVTFDRPLSHYIEVPPSKRVVVGPANVNCATEFADLKNDYNIKEEWKAVNPQGQWFITSRNPSCGLSCGGKFLRTSNNQNSRADIEPVSNYCINRWKGYSLSVQRNAARTACKQSPVFARAEARREAENAIAKMIEDCTNNANCKKVAFAINSLNEAGISLDEIEAEIEDIENSYETAKANNESYVIDSENKFFKSFSKIDNAIISLDQGFDSIKDIQRNTGANFGEALGRMVDSDLPNEFETLDKMESAKKRYKKVAEKMSELIKPEIARYGYTWSSDGRFQVSSGIDVKEVVKVPVENGKIEADIRSLNDFDSTK